MEDTFKFVFNFFSSNLTYILPTFLFSALLFRYFAYKSGKANYTYFTSFSQQAEKLLNKEDKHTKIENVETWLNKFLDKIVKDLPNRSLRDTVSQSGTETGSTFRHRDKESLSEFADGKRSIINAIKQQVDAFKSPHPPNFLELTDRVLTQDRKWNTLMGIIPMRTLSRMLDVLPGLFVIGGIFGTFIGITSALPMIAQIDMSDMAAATAKLADFVDNVSYSMQTSIAGIVCSVVMMVLNAIFPLNTSRSAVRKNLERSFEFIWYRIHGDQLTTGELKIVKSLDRINSSLSRKKTRSSSGRTARKRKAA